MEGFESVIYWDLDFGSHNLVEGFGAINGGVRSELGPRGVEERSGWVVL